MQAHVIFRPATMADIPTITAIYNHAVQNTTAIWNETQVDEANREAWLQDRTAQHHPVLVAEWQEQVVGYATYGQWRAIEGFRHTKEHSVYVKEGHAGQGIGKGLMQALIAEAAGRGVHVLVACVEAENQASLRLHQGLGFRQVGIFREVGQKFGRWLDLTCLELLIKAEPADRQ